MPRQKTPQEEADRVAGRIRFLKRWSTASVEELIEILECGEFTYPMGQDFDSRVILEHLWELHRDELTPTIQERLQILIGTSRLPHRASDQCNAYLLAFRNERDEVMKLWHARGEKSSVEPWFSRISRKVLLDCICHVQIDDRAIVEGLVEDVAATGWLFSPRFDTMVALGKLRASKGTRAAEVIRQSIYDSTAEIIATRERVLERLLTDPDDWIRCVNCCYGRIHGDSCTSETCPTCLGLGLVHSIGRNLPESH